LLKTLVVNRRKKGFAVTLGIGKRHIGDHKDAQRLLFLKPNWR
jgi:hypothetical protein